MDGLRKAVRFGLSGALGGLLAAIVGELVYLFAPAPPEPKSESRPVDVMFVLDVTGSMQSAIDGVRNGIQRFAGDLEESGLDVRVGLTAFRDLSFGEPLEVLRFGQSAFTNDYADFRAQVGQRLRADGGGDQPESSFPALLEAARQDFRPDAAKVLVLITDAPPKPGEVQLQSADLPRALKGLRPGQLHLVVNQAYLWEYDPLWEALPGKFFALEDAARGREGFESILPEISEQIVATFQGVSSSRGFAREDAGTVVTILAAWTGLLALGVCLALVVSQNLSLRRPALRVTQGLTSGIGSLVAGAAIGAATQLLFFLPQLLASDGTPGVIVGTMIALGRVLAWTLLGAALGMGVSFFVPNLRRSRALVGGGIGGLLGGVGFLVMSLAGDVAGRLLGAMSLGLLIGLMVALAEVAFRRAWLEVRFGPKESTTVTLGPDPVRVGSGRTCTVWASGAPEVAFRYWTRRGTILCEDVVHGTTQEVAAGYTQTVGRVTTIVRTSAEAGTAEKGAPARPAPPPPPRPGSLAIASGPVGAPPANAGVRGAPPPAAPPKPVSPPPPRPAAPTASAPTAPPVGAVSRTAGPAPPPPRPAPPPGAAAPVRPAAPGGPIPAATRPAPPPPPRPGGPPPPPGGKGPIRPVPPPKPSEGSGP